MEQILRVLDEKLGQLKEELKIMGWKVERLEKELKEKDEIIKNQSVIIDGLSMTVHEQRGEMR